MTFLHFGRKAVFSLIVALVAIPVLSYAEVATCAIPLGAVCSPGILHVYVLVQKNEEVRPLHQPSDFTVTLRSQTYPQLSFQGSQSGTHMSVVGAYTVEAPTPLNYTPSYSVGCNNSVTNGREATCVVTMNPTSFFSPQKPYMYIPMFCSPAYQNVELGRTATFTAVNGGSEYTYDWATAGRTYAGIGPVMYMQFGVPGVQTVKVTSGAQTATCSVNVLPPNSTVPRIPGTISIAPNALMATPATSLVSIKPDVTLRADYVPSLPNTGFAPVGTLQLTFALIILLVAGIFAAPYVRKTVSTILG